MSRLSLQRTLPKQRFSLLPKGSATKRDRRPLPKLKIKNHGPRNTNHGSINQLVQLEIHQSMNPPIHHPFLHHSNSPILQVRPKRALNATRPSPPFAPTVAVPQNFAQSAASNFRRPAPVWNAASKNVPTAVPISLVSSPTASARLTTATTAAPPSPRRINLFNPLT